MADQNGEINQTFLSVNIQPQKDGRFIGASFVNVNQRKMLLTEFMDNEHLSSLESFILQMNDSNSENKFKVYISMPKFTQDPLLNEKVKDLMGMCQVEFTDAKDIKDGNKDFEKNP